MDLGARVAVESGAGMVVWDDALRVSRHLARIGDGTRLHVSVEREEPKATAAQCRLIWRNYEAALRRCSALSGHTKEELHEAMKRRFLEPTPLYAPNGERIGETYTTRTLSVAKKSDYIERVIALFAGYGVALMDDGPQEAA